MPVLNSRGSTGGMMGLKHAPVGTPLFDAEAPGVGYIGSCQTCRERGGPPVLQASGVGQETVMALLRGYTDTSSD